MIAPLRKNIFNNKEKELKLKNKYKIPHPESTKINLVSWDPLQAWSNYYSISGSSKTKLSLSKEESPGKSISTLPKSSLKESSTLSTSHR